MISRIDSSAVENQRSKVRARNAARSPSPSFSLSTFRYLNLSAVFLLLAACGPGPIDNEPGYPLTGTIVEIFPDERVLAVKHAKVSDVLPAATTRFTVSSGDAAIAAEGREIRARLIPNEGRPSLERIWPADTISTRIVEQHRRQLRQDTTIRGSTPFREVGENMPAFALYDQDGEVFQSRSLRGRNVALNFIYTRCPIPTMCPAATMRMIQLQEEARDADIENFHLVSITLDPTYDTPGLLRQYADAFGIDTANFSFLTGPETAVSDLMDQMGVLVEDEGELASHTLATILADANGRIRHRVFGSNWLVSDFLEQLEIIDNE